MAIPEWLTKWIQQEDDEFADVVCNDNMYELIDNAVRSGEEMWLDNVVCNDDRSFYLALDPVISEGAIIQQNMLNRYVEQHVADQHRAYMQSRDAPTLDASED